MAGTKRSYTMTGKQRRFSPELRADICLRLKRGERPADIARRYKLCDNSVLKFRRMIGDIPERGRRPKLSKSVLAQAETRLRNGEKWALVAADYGVHVHTLLNQLKFRKRSKNAK